MPASGSPGRTRRFLLGLTLVASLAALAGLLAERADLFRPLELGSVDARFRIRGGAEARTPMAVVAIDENTIARLGRWPFGRGLHARMVDRLRVVGARAIVYDVQFTEPGEDPAQDDRLIRAVARADRVVLATTEVLPDGGTLVLGGDDVVRQAGARVGNGSFLDDADGVLRRTAPAVDGLPTLAVVTAETVTGRPVARSRFAGRTAYIDYAGRPASVPTYSFATVLEGRVPASELRGRIVVVGASAANLQDVHLTPFGSDDLMPGGEVQANAIATVLDGLPLRGPPEGVATLAILLLAALAPLVALATQKVRWVVTAALTAAVAWLITAQLAFGAGLVLPVTDPLFALAIGAVGTITVVGFLTALEKERTRDAFARFVPRDVVDDVLAESGGGLRLGGVRREATVLFADLRGFTAFSEGRDPQEVFDVLSRYHAAMSDAVAAHGGALIAYLGDGICAVFGAPLAQADHADRALAAALELTGERLREANAQLAERGGEGFALGVGLNTGPVLSGTVGTEERMEYTALGDTTNVAAHVEGLTKELGLPLLLTGATREALTRPAPALERVGERHIKGRSAPVELWTVGDAPG